MAVERNKAERLDGPYMIQDRDHLSEVGQVGGDTRDSRQSQQGHGDSRQQGGGQQGGERSRRRSKLL
jgi:hypothetical protein